MRRKKIEAAEIKFYNANSRGNNVGDCVKRSISLAFDLSYNEVGKLLNEEMKRTRRDKWNIPPVFGKVIKDLGGSEREFIDNNIKLTVNEFADNNPKGIFLVLCGDTTNKSSHLVCVRDGVIWDSWNCKKKLVGSYYGVDRTDVKEIVDFEAIMPECRRQADDIIITEVTKYMGKKAWEGELERTSRFKDNIIEFNCYLFLDPDGILLTKTRKYNFKINLVLSPTMTWDEAIEYTKKTAKTRAYDRMWAIGEEEKKLVEAAKIEEEMQKVGSAGSKKLGYTTPAESRFIKSLPGWVRPLITYINIQIPGEYHDSYDMTIRKLPQDDKHPNKDKFNFYGYNADEVREKLQRYKDTFEVAGLDYEWDY